MTVLETEADGPPVLYTARLILRPFVPRDANRLAELAGAREIADTMISVAHPLSPEQAHSYIEQYRSEWERCSAATFVVALPEKPPEFIG